MKLPVENRVKVQIKWRNSNSSRSGKGQGIPDFLSLGTQQNKVSPQVTKDGARGGHDGASPAFNCDESKKGPGGSLGIRERTYAYPVCKHGRYKLR